MKFMFVYPNSVKAVQEQLGIGYLSSQLKSAGVETLLWDHTFDSLQDLDTTLERERPDFVGISTNTLDIPFALELARRVRSNSHAQIILGGPGPTLEPDLVNHDCVDVVMRGECDTSLPLFVRGDSDAPGVVTKTKRIPMGSLPNVNCLTPPDHGMFRRHFVKEFHGRKGNLGMFITSRGCPFSCTYCSNSSIRALYSQQGNRNWTRFRNVDGIISEIKESVTSFGISHIYLADDTFTLNSKHVMSFCHQYKERIGLPWYCMARCDTVNESLFREMKRAGCEIVLMGIESGTQRIRESLGRHMTDDQIINAFTAAKKVGLHTISFNMTGAPGETKDDAMKTVELNVRCGVDEAKMTIMTAFPGTPLYTQCKEKGYLAESQSNNYYEGTNLNTEMTFDEKVEVQEELKRRLSK